VDRLGFVFKIGLGLKERENPRQKLPARLLSSNRGHRPSWHGWLRFFKLDRAAPIHSLLSRLASFYQFRFHRPARTRLASFSEKYHAPKITLDTNRKLQYNHCRL
jgi:hypothetical protein